LIAFGAGLMKNSDKPHFAQAAGAALEAATAQMTDQDKTKFTQNIEQRKLLATIDQHRDELQARIDNQKITQQQRQEALQEKATQDQRHNELMTELYGDRTATAQAGQALHATIATGQQLIAQQRADQNAQQIAAQQATTQAAAADRQQRMQETANSNATTAKKELDAQADTIPGLASHPELKQAWVASQVAMQHPTSSLAGSWQSYKPQVAAIAKNEMRVKGTSPAVVLGKYHAMGFTQLTAADLQ
jgi:hypothetical protein